MLKNVSHLHYKIFFFCFVLCSWTLMKKFIFQLSQCKSSSAIQYQEFK